MLVAVAVGIVVLVSTPGVDVAADGLTVDSGALGFEVVAEELDEAAGVDGLVVAPDGEHSSPVKTVPSPFGLGYSPPSRLFVCTFMWFVDQTAFGSVSVRVRVPSSSGSMVQGPLGSDATQ